MAEYRIEILTPAQTELEEIALVHITASGVSSARSVVEGIYRALERLKRYPHSGHPIRDPLLLASGYRYVLAGKYLAVYRVIGDCVVIYHIAHGASDYRKLFKSSAFSD